MGTAESAAVPGGDNMASMTAVSGQDALKRAAAEAAAKRLQDRMVVGLGTGSTAAFVVKEIGRLVAEGLRITGIPTSNATAELARSVGIPLSTLEEHERVDVTIDGADEVERVTLNLIKGRGGALLREKIVANTSERLIIVADETKLVDRLGMSAMPIPVEVVPFGWHATARQIQELGAHCVLRRDAEGRPTFTDGRHYILDCVFHPMNTPEELEAQLDAVVGVVEHGLFLSMAFEVIVGGTSGVFVLERMS